MDKMDVNEHSKVKLAVCDLDGVLRGKYMHNDKFNVALKKGFGFCNVIFGWDMHDELYPNGKYTGWQSGFPDAKATIDEATHRSIPWEDDLSFYIADFSKDREASKICPRSLLKSVIDKANNLGFTPVFAQEFEWFNFIASSDTPDTNDLQTITNGMFGYSILKSSLNSPFFNQLFDDLELFDVPLEGLHTETGPGVLEAAIQKAPILEAADRAVLFKTAVKEIAYQNGIHPNFMAKWNASLPGCSGHIHQSLWNDDRSENYFYQNGEMSEVMKSYIAGQLHCLPHLMPMYAPTVNSYKRLIEGTWAPINASWGHDNRTCAVRVLNGNKDDMRAEMRVPGSDCNPYLAMAAALASGIYGIENRMQLTLSPTKGNAYENIEAQKLPSSLREGTEAMKQSDVAQKLFGDKFIEHFCYSRELEYKQFEQQVTDWELKRYFTII